MEEVERGARPWFWSSLRRGRENSRWSELRSTGTRRSTRAGGRGDMEGFNSASETPWRTDKTEGRRGCAGADKRSDGLRWTRSGRLSAGIGVPAVLWRDWTAHHHARKVEDLL